MLPEQIHALGQRWADAELRADVTVLATLLADDFVAIGPRGFVLHREQWLDRYRSGSLKNEAFTWEDVSVRIYGATAIAVGIQTQRASFQGHDASGRFRLTQVMLHQADQWRIVHLQLSGPIPDMPPSQG